MNLKLSPGSLVPAFSSGSTNPIFSRKQTQPDEAWVFIQDGDETIEAKRRRQSTGASGRAEAPHRRAEGSDSSAGGGGGIPSFGGGSGGGGKKLSGCATVIIVIIAIAYYLLFGNQSQPDNQGNLPNENSPIAVQDTQEAVENVPAEATSLPAVELPTEVLQPTQAPPAKITPLKPVGGTGKTWTVMLYQDADDEILEQDIMLDLNEAERVGSIDQVKIITQLDRTSGGYTGDGDWSGARRYLVTKDDDLKRIRSKLIGDLGEVNMSDPRTLIDFVTWTVKNYPADKYALILSDHGMGWPGGWSDQDSKQSKKSNIPLVKAAGNQMYLMEIDQALGEIRKQTGIGQFELIGLDACLMSDMEVYAALAAHARYAVASQETEPSLGWAYTGFLRALANNPGISGAELGKQVVQTYIKDDQRIVDNQARAEFLRQGSPMGGLFGVSDVGAKALAQEVERGVTLTAVDMSVFPTVMARFNQLSFILQSENQSLIARSRTYAQPFTSVFGDQVPPSYIDLGNFINIIQKESRSAKVQNAVTQLRDSLRPFIIAEKHGSDKPGASGVSIYFPNSKLFSLPATGPISYTAIANRFAATSLWDDFLAYHYTKRGFEPTTTGAVSPAPNTRVRAPGTGTIDVSPIVLSSNEAAPDQPVTLTSKLRGKNIGYVYLFLGYIDQESNSVMVTDIDYLESPKTTEVEGVFYPQWSDNESFNLEYEWKPTVFAISDGEKTVSAVLNPTLFGASGKDAVYTVDGYYSAADSGDSRFAKLYFRDGKLQQVFAFTGDNQSGAPHEMVPQTGDTFTILDKWLDPVSGGGFKESMQKGESLTFGDNMFTWKELYAAAGDYIIGFIVTDLDGNSKEVYEKVTVR